MEKAVSHIFEQNLIRIELTKIIANRLTDNTLMHNIVFIPIIYIE